MDYKQIYNQIISNAQNRAKPEVYTERHHILPVALGGTNDASNIVILTAREHFLAHYLLWRFSSGNAKYKMASAFNAMNMNPKDSKRYVNSRLYASLREDLAKAVSKINKGKKMSDEARAKMSAAHKGKKTSDETKANRRVAIIEAQVKLARKAGNQVAERQAQRKLYWARKARQEELKQAA